MKVDLEESEKDMAADGLRALLMKGTIEHLLTQLTPERLETFLGETMKKTFDTILGNGSGWGNQSPIQKAVDDYAKPIVNEMLAQPEVQTRIRQACVEALDKFIGKLPEDISKRLHEAAAEGIRSRFKFER